MTRKRKKRRDRQTPAPETAAPEAASAGSETTDEPTAAPAGVRMWLGNRELIIIITWIVFLNALPNGLHLDDAYRVKDNPGIHQVWPVWRHFVDPRTSATAPHLVQYRPLLPLTLSFNYAIAGDSAGGYRLVNLLFHIISALLVYSLCLELLTHWSRWVRDDRKRGLLALGVALIYGVHPVSGIPVNYICARDLLIMQTFLLASLLAYVRMRRLGDTPLRWAWVLGALALSMMGKTNSIVAPGLVLVFEALVARRSLLTLRPWLRAAAVGSVIVAFMAYTRLVLGFSDFQNVVGAMRGSVWTYPLTQLKLHLFEYMRNFVWPFMIRQAPQVEPAQGFGQPEVLMGAAFIAATLLAAWRLRRNAPLIAFCILAYWTLMIPEASILPLHHLAAHYRAYAPSPFLYLAVGMIAVHYMRWNTLVPAYWLALAFFALSSIYLNTTWLTSESLWSHSVKYGGEPVAHLNLGMAHDDPAERKKHLEDALALAPNYVYAHINLGLALLALEQPERGMWHLNRAVELDPHAANTHYWLSEGYTRLGRKHDAARASARAARLDPRNLRSQMKAARDAIDVGEFDRAVEHLNAVLEHAPARDDALFLRGLALQRAGKPGAAVGDYEAYLERNPAGSQAHFNLAHALMTAGRHEAAVEHFRTTLDLKPDYREAHLHLATCYRALGDDAAAERHRQQWEQQNR